MKKLNKLSIVLIFISIIINNLYALSKIWEKTYGGNKSDIAFAITPTEDDGFIVSGFTYSFGNGGSDVYLIKIDKNGNKIWQRTYGGSKNDIAYAITPTKDGNFIVAGFTYSFSKSWHSNLYLIKIGN